MTVSKVRTLAIGCAVLLAIPAYAADHRVQMLNKDSSGQTMAFEPAFLKIAPGDTVTWIATDKTHNTESIKGMTPEGGQTWKGKVNEEVSVTFTQEGVYGYKCTPHYAMGMVGLIQVGENPPNLEGAKSVKHPAFPQKRMDANFAKVGAANP